MCVGVVRGRAEHQPKPRGKRWKEGQRSNPACMSRERTRTWPKRGEPRRQNRMPNPRRLTREGKQGQQNEDVCAAGEKKASKRPRDTETIMIS